MLSVFLIISVIFIVLIRFLIKIKSGLKLMLIGIHITLIGGILAIDTSSTLEGVEYFLVCGGFVISLIGALKNSS